MNIYLNIRIKSFKGTPLPNVTHIYAFKRKKCTESKLVCTNTDRVPTIKIMIWLKGKWVFVLTSCVFINCQNFIFLDDERSALIRLYTQLANCHPVARTYEPLQVSLLFKTVVGNDSVSLTIPNAHCFLKVVILILVIIVAKFKSCYKWNNYLALNNMYLDSAWNL